MKSKISRLISSPRLIKMVDFCSKKSSLIFAYFLNLFLFTAQMFTSLLPLIFLLIFLDLVFILLSRNRVLFFIGLLTFSTKMRGLNSFIVSASSIFFAEILCYYFVSMLVHHFSFSVKLSFSTPIFILSIIAGAILSTVVSLRNGTFGGLNGTLRVAFYPLLPIFFGESEKGPSRHYLMTGKVAMYWYYAFFLLCSTAFSFLLTRNGYLSNLFYSFTDNSFENNHRFCGFFNNPDWLPVPVLMLSLFAITFSFENKKTQRSFLAMVGLLNIAAIYSGSKMEIVCLIFIAVLLLLKFCFAWPKFFLPGICLLSAVCGIAFLAFGDYLLNFIESRILFLDTYKLGFLHALTTNRTTIMMTYSKEIFQNPLYFLFGNYNVYTGINTVSTNHNTFLAYIWTYGFFFGGILAYYLFVYCLEPLRKGGKKGVINSLLVYGTIFILLNALFLFPEQPFMLTFYLCGAREANEKNANVKTAEVLKLAI